MYYTTLLKDIYMYKCVCVCVCIGKHEDRIITLAGAWPSGRFLPPEKGKKKTHWLWLAVDAKQSSISFFPLSIFSFYVYTFDDDDDD
jgi:hypothetical protein